MAPQSAIPFLPLRSALDVNGNEYEVRLSQIAGGDQRLGSPGADTEPELGVQDIY